MKVAIIGECMVEFFKDTKLDLFQQTFGGDTFNCAVYLKREFADINVEYITILGKDVFSQNMIDFMHKQNINTNYIEQIDTRNAALYIINTIKGERTFTYYRDKSAAKKLFTTALTKNIINDLQSFDLIYFSAITLAIMEKKGRGTFFDILKKARKNGVKIAFDSNYRPSLYKNCQNAKRLYLKALKHSDIFLPSLDDEIALWGEISSHKIIKRARDLGCKEIAIKCGKNSISYNKKKQTKVKKVKSIDTVVDTTAAGDSFNGAYLANRLKKYSKKKSLAQGIKTAKKVIMTQGAIIPK